MDCLLQKGLYVLFFISIFSFGSPVSPPQKTLKVLPTNGSSHHLTVTFYLTAPAELYYVLLPYEKTMEKKEPTPYMIQKLALLSKSFSKDQEIPSKIEQDDNFSSQEKELWLEFQTKMEQIMKDSKLEHNQEFDGGLPDLLMDSNANGETKGSNPEFVSPCGHLSFLSAQITQFHLSGLNASTAYSLWVVTEVPESDGVYGPLLVEHSIETNALPATIENASCFPTPGKMTSISCSVEYDGKHSNHLYYLLEYYPSSQIQFPSRPSSLLFQTFHQLNRSLTPESNDFHWSFSPPSSFHKIGCHANGSQVSKTFRFQHVFEIDFLEIASSYAIHFTTENQFLSSIDQTPVLNGKVHTLNQMITTFDLPPIFQQTEFVPTPSTTSNITFYYFPTKPGHYHSLLQQTHQPNFTSSEDMFQFLQNTLSQKEHTQFQSNQPKKSNQLPLYTNQTFTTEDIQHILRSGRLLSHSIGFLQPNVSYTFSIWTETWKSSGILSNQTFQFSTQTYAKAPQIQTFQGICLNGTTDTIQIETNVSLIPSLDWDLPASSSKSFLVDSDSSSSSSVSVILHLLWKKKEQSKEFPHHSTKPNQDSIVNKEFTVDWIQTKALQNGWNHQKWDITNCSQFCPLFSFNLTNFLPETWYEFQPFTETWDSNGVLGHMENERYPSIWIQTHEEAPDMILKHCLPTNATVHNGTCLFQLTKPGFLHVQVKEKGQTSFIGHLRIPYQIHSSSDTSSHHHHHHRKNIEKSIWETFQIGNLTSNTTYEVTFYTESKQECQVFRSMSHTEIFQTHERPPSLSYYQLVPMNGSTHGLSFSGQIERKVPSILSYMLLPLSSPEDSYNMTMLNETFHSYLCQLSQLYGFQAFQPETFWKDRELHVTQVGSIPINSSFDGVFDFENLISSLKEDTCYDMYIVMETWQSMGVCSPLQRLPRTAKPHFDGWFPSDGICTHASAPFFQEISVYPMNASFSSIQLNLTLPLSLNLSQNFHSLANGMWIHYHLTNLSYQDPLIIRAYDSEIQPPFIRQSMFHLPFPSFFPNESIPSFFKSLSKRSSPPSPVKDPTLRFVQQEAIQWNATSFWTVFEILQVDPLTAYDMYIINERPYSEGIFGEVYGSPLHVLTHAPAPRLHQFSYEPTKASNHSITLSIQFLTTGTFHFLLLEDIKWNQSETYRTLTNVFEPLDLLGSQLVQVTKVDYRLFFLNISNDSFIENLPWDSFERHANHRLWKSIDNGTISYSHDDVFHSKLQTKELKLKIPKRQPNQILEKTKYQICGVAETSDSGGIVGNVTCFPLETFSDFSDYTLPTNLTSKKDRLWIEPASGSSTTLIVHYEMQECPVFTSIPISYKELNEKCHRRPFFVLSVGNSEQSQYERSPKELKKAIRGRNGVVHTAETTTFPQILSNATSSSIELIWTLTDLDNTLEYSFSITTETAVDSEIFTKVFQFPSMNQAIPFQKVLKPHPNPPRITEYQLHPTLGRIDAIDLFFKVEKPSIGTVYPMSYEPIYKEETKNQENISPPLNKKNVEGQDLILHIAILTSSCTDFPQFTNKTNRMEHWSKELKKDTTNISSIESKSLLIPSHCTLQLYNWSFPSSYFKNSSLFQNYTWKSLSMEKKKIGDFRLNISQLSSTSSLLRDRPKISDFDFHLTLTGLNPNTSYQIILATETPFSNSIFHPFTLPLKVQTHTFPPVFQQLDIYPKPASTSQLYLAFQLAPSHNGGTLHYVISEHGKLETDKNGTIPSIYDFLEHGKTIKKKEYTRTLDIKSFDFHQHIEILDYLIPNTFYDIFVLMEGKGAIFGEIYPFYGIQTLSNPPLILSHSIRPLPGQLNGFQLSYAMNAPGLLHCLITEIQEEKKDLSGDQTAISILQSHWKKYQQYRFLSLNSEESGKISSHRSPYSNEKKKKSKKEKDDLLHHQIQYFQQKERIFHRQTLNPREMYLKEKKSNRNNSNHEKKDWNQTMIEQIEMERDFMNRNWYEAFEGIEFSFQHTYHFYILTETWNSSGVVGKIAKISNLQTYQLAPVIQSCHVRPTKGQHTSLTMQIVFKETRKPWGKVYYVVSPQSLPSDLSLPILPNFEKSQSLAHLMHPFAVNPTQTPWKLDQMIDLNLLENSSNASTLPWFNQQTQTLHFEIPSLRPNTRYEIALLTESFGRPFGIFSSAIFNRCQGNSQTYAAPPSLVEEINCQDAPNCKALYRHDCWSMENTCGECFEGYEGIQGPANSSCWDATTKKSHVTPEISEEVDTAIESPESKTQETPSIPPSKKDKTEVSSTKEASSSTRNTNESSSESSITTTAAQTTSSTSKSSSPSSSTSKSHTSNDVPANSCPPNSKMVSSGECVCMNGYRLNSRGDGCESMCPLHSTMTAPGQCTCDAGFTLSPDGTSCIISIQTRPHTSAEATATTASM